MSYAEKFDLALRELSTNQENYLEEWVYAGGDSGRHARWFNLYYGEMKMPPYQDECICTHPISEQCFIQNRITKELVVVGNCCIKCYLLNSGRTCLNCNKKHKKPEDHFSFWLRTLLKDEESLFLDGEYSLQSFEKVFESDRDYCLDYARNNKDSKIFHWLHESNKLTPEESLLISSIPNEEEILGAQTLNVGKHKGKTFSEILTLDASYCRWVRSLSKANGQLLEFRQWLETQ